MFAHSGFAAAPPVYSAQVASSLLLRPAVRAVLVDPSDRVLLVRWRFPTADVWGTPGGGIEPGEDHESALRRELLEETGMQLPAASCGSCVAHRVHVIAMEPGYGTYDGLEEWYYLVRVDAFAPRGRLTDEQLAAEYVQELRWCTVAEIRALTHEPRVRTAPRALADFAQTLIEAGRPVEPVELEV